jgi:DNA-binding CsgD family transcriptional regulator
MQEVNKDLKQLLSKSDLVSLMDLIRGSLCCTGEADLTLLLKRLRQLVPHDFAICGSAQMGDIGNFISYNTFTVNYPEEWAELQIAKKFNLLEPYFLIDFSGSGLLRHSRLSRSRQISLSDTHYTGLIRNYTLGTKNRLEATHSLFSFSGKSLEQHQRTKIILENVLPHFHLALNCIVSAEEEKKKKTPAPSISPREKEVLLWFKEGKTSWAVSRILNISERTVNFHASNIMQKLGADSRMHAVAIAAGLKLIDLD